MSIIKLLLMSIILFVSFNSIAQISIEKKRKKFEHTLQIGYSFTRLYNPATGLHYPWNNTLSLLDPVSHSTWDFYKSFNYFSYNLLYKHKFSLSTSLLKYFYGDGTEPDRIGAIAYRHFYESTLALGYNINPLHKKNSFLNIQAGYALLNGYERYITYIDPYYNPPHGWPGSIEYAKNRNVTSSGVIGGLQYNYKIWRIISISGNASYTYYFDKLKMISLSTAAGITF